MKSKFHIRTSLIVSIVLIISMFVIFYENSKIKNETNIEFIEKINYKSNWYNNIFECNYKLIGEKLEDVLCETSNGENIQLSNICNDKPILIFRYTDINCNTCYEEEINRINKIFDENKSNIIILCSYKVKRDFLTFKKLNKIRIPIYRVPDNFDKNIDNIMSPFYILLQKNMIISNIYT